MHFLLKGQIIVQEIEFHNRPGVILRGVDTKCVTIFTGQRTPDISR